MGPLIALAIVALPGGIHGELFAPDGGGRHAAVVLLHGGAGLTRRGSDFRAYARDLARNGFVVLLRITSTRRTPRRWVRRRASASRSGSGRCGIRSSGS